MAITYRNNTHDILLRDDRVMDRQRLSSAGHWEDEQQIQFPFLDFNFREQYMEGTHIGYCRINVHETVHLSTDKQAPMPGLVYVQKGQLITYAHGSKSPMPFTSKEYNILINPYSAQETTFLKQQLEVLTISFLPERFLDLISNIGPTMDKVGDSIAGNGIIPTLGKEEMCITPRMQALITEMMNCRYAGGLRKLFIHAKAIELLQLHCEQQEQIHSGKKTNVKLFPADIEKLKQAKEILLSDIQHPPSLTALGRQTGLNEFKLKSGFRMLFNNSVFGYLRDHRLQYARQLIHDSQLSMTEIAYETGYSTLPHFSNEFRKKFGTNPSKLRSN